MLVHSSRFELVHNHARVLLPFKNTIQDCKRNNENNNDKQDYDGDDKY